MFFNICLDILRIDSVKQEGNLTHDSYTCLEEKKARDFTIKARGHWRKHSRVKLIKQGHCNCEFFHRVTNGRRQELINSLESEDGVILDNLDIRDLGFF